MESLPIFLLPNPFLKKKRIPSARTSGGRRGSFYAAWQAGTTGSIRGDPFQVPTAPETEHTLTLYDCIILLFLVTCQQSLPFFLSASAHAQAQSSQEASNPR
jgi:hypothetical protein